MLLKYILCLRGLRTALLINRRTLGCRLVPMWLKRLTNNELGSIAKFNESMSLLGSVPQREIPIYQALTPTQIAP